MLLRVKLLDHFDKELGLPAYGSSGASGVDLKACFDNRKNLIINPGERVLIPTGISVEIPDGYEWQIRPRSGLSLRTGIIVPNSPGTIDSDYRGEIKVILGNFSNAALEIKHGERIAQAVLCAFERVKFQVTSDLETSSRGTSGFGSTGKN